MNTKTVAVIVIFAALAIALNLSPIKIPAPYAPYLIYQIWEIPIVIAFLLFGAVVGVLIAVVNTLALFAFFPGALPTGPLYNLIAIFSMLIGVYIGRRFFTREAVQEKAVLKIAAASTVLGMALRIAVMTVVNYTTLRQGYPIGFGMDELAILAFLPLAALFNGTTVLYTVPVGEFIASVVKSRLKLKS